jgi:hypothetical protein
LGAAVIVALWSVQMTATAGQPGPAVLRVGTWHGIRGQFTDIQAAVDVARPGDWILVGPGDYHPGSPASPSQPAGVLIRTARLHLRGMDRNSVIIDGTRSGAPATCSARPAWQDAGPTGPAGQPSGRNGVEVYKADGVYVENLTVCNFLSSRSAKQGNQVWWNGGDGSGKIGMSSWWGSYLTATTTYNRDGQVPQAQYGIFASNARGPGGVMQSFASNMADSGFYVGACPDCNAVLDHVHSENNSIGFSGTNAGGHLVIEDSVWDRNEAGIVPNVLNNDDAPPPQDGACQGVPGSGGRPLYSGPQPKRCTIISRNEVYDNNNPNAPGSGIAGSAAVGTGIELVGTRNVAVVANDVHDNGAWGIVVHDFPDTENPPPVSRCEGGISLPASICYFQAFGNEVASNRLRHNGFFANPTNGDLALDTTLHAPGNCFVSNTDPHGLTTDPPGLQGPPWSRCDTANAGDNGSLTAELVCDSGLLGSCPALPGVTYPKRTAVRLLPLPVGLPSMPDPCEGVPANPWCAGSR